MSISGPRSFFGAQPSGSAPVAQSPSLHIDVLSRLLLLSVLVRDDGALPVNQPAHFFNTAVPGAAGFTETRLGGPRPEKTDQRSAAERAVAAAAAIPDPDLDPESPKRVKPKKVSWADDSLLQSVRLFSLVSPAALRCLQTHTRAFPGLRCCRPSPAGL